jgi:hypothetical protein
MLSKTAFTSKKFPPIVRAAAASVFLLAAAVPAGAADMDPGMRMAIRIYDNSGFRNVEVQAATETVTAIFRQAGIGVEWVSCDAGKIHGSEHRCSSPLGGNELAVRLVRIHTDASYLGDLPLGYSLVDVRTHSGALATVFMDRVLWLAGNARLDVRPLLGRAIAHELGHLLLGTNEHANGGLMRAVWSSESLRAQKATDWTFETPQAEAIRQGLRLRAGPPQVANLVSGR